MKTREQLLRDEAIERDAALKAVMGSPAGRVVIWGIVERGGATRLSFAGEETHTSAFNEGRREVALWLMAEAQRVAPADFARMYSEQVEHARTVAQLLSEAKPADE